MDLLWTYLDAWLILVDFRRYTFSSFRSLVDFGCRCRDAEGTFPPVSTLVGQGCSVPTGSDPAMSSQL